MIFAHKPINYWWRIGWYLALIVFLAYRVFILLQYHVQYTDYDQTLIWDAAYDMAHGNFYEPKFYGQTYVVLLESLFAVPLVWMGVEVNMAVPLVTFIMAITPFLLVSFFEHRKGNHPGAVTVLAIALCLPVEYDLITGLSRGFVGGLFLASFGLLALYKPSNPSILLAGIFMALGVVVTPNSLLLVVPLVVLLVYKSEQRLKTTGLLLLSALPGIGYEVFSQVYYHYHPEHIVWTELNMDWQWELWLQSFTELDFLLGNLVPVLWSQGWVLPLLFVVLVFVFIRQRKTGPLLVVLCVLLVWLVTIGLWKGHNGYRNLFLPMARIYLAFPLLLCFIACRYLIKPRAALFMAAASLVLIPLKLWSVDATWQHHFTEARAWIVRPIEVKVLEQKCTDARVLAGQYDCDLVLVGFGFVEGGYSMCYGCHSLTGNDINITYGYDRRTWRLQELAEQRYDRILFIAGDTATFQAQMDTALINYVRVDEPNTYLITGTSLNPMELFEKGKLRQFR